MQIAEGHMIAEGVGGAVVQARAAVVDAIEALTNDAARYQWLRGPTDHDSIHSEVHTGPYIGAYWDCGIPKSGAELDQAIDAAIAAIKESK